MSAKKAENQLHEWDDLLSSISHLQEIIPEAVLVGGSAAVLYADHRLSTDHDHVVIDLKSRFNDILNDLEVVSGWKTARVQSPVQILGRLDGIETGVRQLKRTAPLETQIISVRGVSINVPTIEETLRIKVFLALTRNATRDYLDVAALSEKIGDGKVYEALSRMDELYPQLNGDNWAVRQQIVKQFTQAEPYDLDDVNLDEYKGLKPPYTDWGYVQKKTSLIADYLMDKFCCDLVLEDTMESKKAKESLDQWRKNVADGKKPVLTKLPGLPM